MIPLSECRYSPLVRGCFEWYRKKILFRQLDGVYGQRAFSLGPVTDRPIVVAANHASWWDGFLLFELQRRYFPGYVIYTVMLDSELAKMPRFFRRLGMIPMVPGSVGSVRAVLRQLTALSQHQPMLLSFFPQGRIRPTFRRPLDFRPGIRTLISTLKPRVLPVAIHMEPLNRQKPTFFVSAGEFLDALPAVIEIERAVCNQLDAIQSSIPDSDQHGLESWESWK
jgi:1-acyl-sn-glycerol-3-phosphate acyltransferase